MMYEIKLKIIKNLYPKIQVWRGLRDLNSRAGFPTYSLSRGGNIYVI